MNRKTKSDGIEKNYNRRKKGVLPKSKFEAARKAAEEIEILRFAKEKEGWDKEILSLSDQIQKLTKKMIALKKKAGYPPEDDIKTGNGKDVTMLRDMWQIYRMSGGMARLQEVMKDPKEFRSMAKEMLRVEAMVSTKKKEESQAGQVVYVVLKGLQPEPVFDVAPEVKQVTAMLDPSGRNFNG